MSKNEIRQILEKAKNDIKSEPEDNIYLTSVFGLNIVNEKEYDYIKKEIEKLKEKYSNLEQDIKREINEKINEIKFKDFLGLIDKLKNISRIDNIFQLYKEKKENISYEELIKFYYKLKHIILLKGVSSCYTLYFKNALYFFCIFNFLNETSKESIIETDEISTFIFSNIFRIGEEKYENIQNELVGKYPDSIISNEMYNLFYKIKEEPMRKPNSNLEKIVSNIMKIQDTQGKLNISNDLLYNFNKNFEENIDSFNEFEKDFYNIILIPIIRELNKEVMIEKMINNDLIRPNIEINTKNRLFFYLGENLGKDEDLTNEYKNYHHLDKLNKNDKAFPILQKTICSFLNTKGGRIYIGIDDNFEVIGYNISNKKIKNKIKNNLINLVSSFYPKVENDKIKVHFIPIKNSEDDDYEDNKYVIKIIVSQGNIKKLYSIYKDSYKSFIRLPGVVRELSCEDMKEEIIKRTFNNEQQLIDPKEFNDMEPDEFLI